MQKKNLMRFLLKLIILLFFTTIEYLAKMWLRHMCALQRDSTLTQNGQTHYAVH